MNENTKITKDDAAGKTAIEEKQARDLEEARETLLLEELARAFPPEDETERPGR